MSTLIIQLVYDISCILDGKMYIISGALSSEKLYNLAMCIGNDLNLEMPFYTVRINFIVKILMLTGGQQNIHKFKES